MENAQLTRCHWGRVQGSSEVGGLLLNTLFASFETGTAIQVAGLIELPCAIPSKGACDAGGRVGVSGISVGVVELFLSAIDAGVVDSPVVFLPRWSAQIRT